MTLLPLLVSSIPDNTSIKLNFFMIHSPLLKVVNNLFTHSKTLPKRLRSLDKMKIIYYNEICNVYILLK